MTTALTSRQRALLDSWLGEWITTADHSWPLQDTLVLRVRGGDGDFIIKASEISSHIRREIDSHREVLDAISAPVPHLEHADVEAGILVTRFVPGELVQGTPAEWEPGTYRQAGAILALLQRPGTMSRDYVDRLVLRCRRLLGEADGLIAAGERERLTAILDRTRTRPVRLHFTHGDYQPRNWLRLDDHVSVIDFGRGAQRSWVSDLVRLQNQQFVGREDLEHAFMAGLGRMPDEDDERLLALETFNESVGTVVWAHSIGDGAFEEHGRTMVERILAAG